MIRRTFISFLCAFFAFNFLLPVSHSAQTITGQVLFNGQASANFEVLLWRNGKSDNELAAEEKLTRINLEPNGSFTISPETRNFTIMLFPLFEYLKGPAILYDYEDEKLSTKIVLSDIPKLEYNIKFENQDNAISQYAISNYINATSQKLLQGTTYIVDPKGIKVPILATASLPKIWSQEADVINEKISKLQEYALRNSQALTGEKYLVNLSRSLSLLSIPKELVYVSAAQIDPREDIKEFETGFMEISYGILKGNRVFADRIISLVSIANSQINLNLKKVIEPKKQQQIVWENPTFASIALSKDLLNLRLSSTSGLKIEIGSYTQNVCSVVGKKIRLSSIGTCSLYVLQQGDSEFLPSPPFKIDFLVQTSALKQSTITCVKGKLSKKVTAQKPKCPSGYQLKR